MPYVRFKVPQKRKGLYEPDNNHTTGDTTDKVFRVYDQIRQRSPAQADAADLLGMWERNFRRYSKRFEADGEDGCVFRQARAKSVFDDLEVWLRGQLNKISGKTPLAKAIRYALTRLPKARLYLGHGVLELDNNTAERAVRPVTLGRKNYLFMGLIAGGKSAASAYTLIETSKSTA